MDSAFFDGRLLDEPGGAPSNQCEDRRPTPLAPRRPGFDVLRTALEARRLGPPTVVVFRYRVPVRRQKTAAARPVRAPEHCLERKVVVINKHVSACTVAWFHEGPQRPRAMFAVLKS